MHVTAASGLLAYGSTKNTKLVMTMWPKSATMKTIHATESEYTTDTWWVISEHEQISFDIAYSGIDPASGEQLVSSGDRFVLWCVCGDGDFFVNDLHFPHWNSDSMCLGLCLAQKASGPWCYNDFRASSKWRSRPLSTTFLIENHLAPHRHPWFNAKGVTVFMLMMDVLHCLDQNGCRSHLIGSLLFEFVYFENSHIPQKNALAKVWRRIDELYTQLRVETKLTRLTLDMFCDKAAPHQSFAILSTAVKGAEQRHLMPVMVKLCEEMNSGSEHHRMRLLCIKSLLQFDKLAAGCSLVPSKADGAAMYTALDLFLTTYQGCADWAAREGHLLFQSVPKFHYTFHMAEQSRFLGPRSVWTYGWEDLVGIVIQLAHSCSVGTPAMSVPRKALGKYRIAMHVQLSRQWE